MTIITRGVESSRTCCKFPDKSFCHFVWFEYLQAYQTCLETKKAEKGYDLKLIWKIDSFVE